LSEDQEQPSTPPSPRVSSRRRARTAGSDARGRAPASDLGAAPATEAAVEETPGSASAVAVAEPELDSHAAGNSPAAADLDRKTGDGEEDAGLYEPFWRTGLPNVGAVALRELTSLFVSPIGWVLGALVIFPVTAFGFLPEISGGQAGMDSVFSVITFLALFLVPLYTMRVFSEEKRTGTLEIILTSSVRDWELVVGKWLGSLLFFLATNLYTLGYLLLLIYFLPSKGTIRPLGISISIATLDYGTILTEYVGLVLLAGALCSAGVLLSSLTQNQVIAAVGGIVLLLVMWFLGTFAGNFVAPPVSNLLDYANLQGHFSSFNQGQLALKDVVFFLSMTVAFLFVTTRVIESRRWR
jgi:ABC-2 type transport system permease protein